MNWAKAGRPSGRPVAKRPRGPDLAEAELSSTASAPSRIELEGDLSNNLRIAIRPTCRPSMVSDHAYPASTIDPSTRTDGRLRSDRFESFQSWAADSKLT